MHPYPTLNLNTAKQVFNNWEAHRTDTKYENHLIAKIFIFEFCNSFLSMIWICFLATYYCHSMYGLTQTLIGKEYLPQEFNVEKMKTSCVYKKYGDPATCRKAARASIMQELNSKLMSLFLIRMFIGICPSIPLSRSSVSAASVSIPMHSVCLFFYAHACIQGHTTLWPLISLLRRRAGE
jgi:hypothetical protein